MPSRRLAATASLLVILTGCSSTPAGGRGMMAVGAPDQAHSEFLVVAEDGAAADGYLASSALPVEQRQIVREAHASLEVADPARAAERVIALAGPPGYVEHTQRMDDDVQLVLRVPAERLDAFLESLEDLGEVEHLSVSGHDVTEQLVDWQARLDNLTALRDRLREHLGRAAGVQDLVMVERELARVQAEIDSLSGRLQAMRGAVALSRVSVLLRRKTRLGPLGALFYGLGRAVAWLFVID